MRRTGLSPRGVTSLVVLIAILVMLPLGGPRRAGASGLIPVSNFAGTFLPERFRGGVISEQQAIRTAMHMGLGYRVNRLPGNVHMRVSFGRETETMLNERLVWLVRFWGPGVDVPVLGPGGCGLRAKRDEWVLVDARTGKGLEVAAGALPAGLPTVPVTLSPISSPCPIASPTSALGPPATPRHR